MLYLPISRAWVISRAAARFYLLCSLGSLGLSGTLIGAIAALRMSSADSSDLPVFLVLALRLVLLVGSLASAVVCVAMWYFWFNFDSRGWIAKAMWFLLLYLFPTVGPALYYFLIYRTSGLLPNPPAAS